MLKVAIIGPGQVAEKVHAGYYNTRTDILDLCAVSGTHLGRATAFCERNNFKRAYTDVDEMLAVEQPDIVSVFTPNKFHYTTVLKCLKSGASVFCEKPPAMNATEAKEMAEQSERYGGILAYNLQHRHSNRAQLIKQHIQSLGEVYFVEVEALRRSGVPGWGPFIDKSLQGGGPLIDYGIHMLDTALYLLNYPKPIKLKAYTFEKLGKVKHSGSFGNWDPSNYTVEDALIGTIEFETGMIMRLSTSFILNIKEESLLDVKIYGEEGGDRISIGEIYSDQDGELVIHHRAEPERDRLEFRSIHQFVERCLGKSDTLITDAWQGYQLQHLIEQLYYSADSGKEVVL